jgi:hypothetical protein
MDLMAMMGIDIDSVAKDAKEFIGLLTVMNSKIDLVMLRQIAIMDALEIEDVRNGPENTIKQLAKS